MQVLGRTDVRFLDSELPRRPMHTLKIAVVRPSPGKEFAALRDSFSRRLDRVPTLRWRLAFPPGGFGRPSWVEDGEFDLDHHLVRVDAPSPGGHRELCDVVARAAEAPLLDRHRPLWQIWVVEGLTENRLAVIVRVHHAFADGVSSARILASWFAPETHAANLRAGQPPGTVVHLTRAITGGTAGIARDVTSFVRAARSARRKPEPEVPPSPFSGQPLGPRRRFGCQTLSLDAVHAARRPLEATVNDLLIALIATALRGYLRDRNALPATPLVALMPVSLLPAAEHGLIGNRGLATTKVTLPTDVEDPVARVRAASTAAKQAKEELATTAGARLEDAVDLLPRTAIRVAANLFDRRPRLALGNLTLSNVRGPAEPLAADGFTTEDFFSVGQCAPGVGLNITAWSYAGRFNVALLADANKVQDPWDILERLPPALEELGASATRRMPRPALHLRAGTP